MLPEEPPFVDPGDAHETAEVLARDLTRRTGREPSAVAAAPGRVNLIGEHLDYNAGSCLPVALPHATYAALAPRDDGLLSVTSLQLQESRQARLDDLHPGAVTGWVTYVAGVLWALREEGWDLQGVDVVVDSRVPIGSGLSSSAALECSVAVALLAVAGVPDTEEVRRQLVTACVRAEREMAGAPTGGMDQSIALFARPGHALLLDFADGTPEQVPWEPAVDGLALVVVDTGVAHRLTEGGYASRRADCEAAARTLGLSTLREAKGRPELLERLTDGRQLRRARHVLGEMVRVDHAAAALRRGDHAALGPLLNASHESLRDDFEVSCDELDVAVDTCRDHGALGGRMTGAGFGGSAIALLPRPRVGEAAAAVADAFARRGWRAPQFLHAPACGGARLLR